MTDPEQINSSIKSMAQQHGFMMAGVARVRKLDEENQRLTAWLDAGYHGDMQYMAKHKDLRLDPGILVPGAKSIICLAFNYYNPDVKDDQAPKIAMYAQGRDYHKVVKKKLKKFWAAIKEKIYPEAKGRYFVDSAPIMERQWAQLAGLGWTGKNTLLINPKAGSYFFLAEIICDLDLKEDVPMEDHCGTCTRCIDACPTEAITPEGYVLKANQCISYATIESSSPVPSEIKTHQEGWAFGCDICQQVCPWNKFSKPHAEPEFLPAFNRSDWDKMDWINLREDQFDQNFGHTPLKRAGYIKFKSHVDDVLF